MSLIIRPKIKLIFAFFTFHTDFRAIFIVISVSAAGQAIFSAIRGYRAAGAPLELMDGMALVVTLCTINRATEHRLG